MKRAVLVSCVSMKRTDVAAAKDLYVSPWFRLARTYAERQGVPWFILSAKHGLIAPDQMIGPYEMTLRSMNRDERLAWARQVETDLLAHLQSPVEICMLAGLKYREFLTPLLNRRGVHVSVPMEGLGIGSQLQWLKTRHVSRRHDHAKFNDERGAL